MANQFKSSFQRGQAVDIMVPMSERPAPAPEPVQPVRTESSKPEPRDKFSTSIRIDPEMRKVYKVYGINHGMNLTQLIKTAIDEYMRNHP